MFDAVSSRIGPVLVLAVLTSGSLAAGRQGQNLDEVRSHAAATVSGVRSHPTWPGRMIASEPLPEALWLPSSSRAHRVYYLSTGDFGLPTVVSGVLFVPGGQAPASGWPVLSWGHGTIGVADLCAPSTAGRSARDISYLSSWLRSGYAVAATDYRGLGTVGPHPYIDGAAAARDMIDMVRAARQVEPSLSTAWFAVGQSQGAHAALFAGSFAATYAPELDLRGTIATAPPTQWRMTITETDALNPSFPANPILIPILAGLEAAHPLTFHADRYLNEAGRDIYRDSLHKECIPATAGRLAGLVNGSVYDIDAAEHEQLIRLLELQDIPVTGYNRPVYIAQGLADRVVYPPASRVTADALRAAGVDVTFVVYPAADHDGVLAAAFRGLLAWAAAAGRPQ